MSEAGVRIGGVLEIRDLTPDRWDDVVPVMGTRGDPAWCWCQYFRLRGKAWQNSTRERNCAALREQVETGVPGVLAYTDGLPVGWCAVARRQSYERLAHSDVAGAVPDEDGLWAVTCFVVRVGHRRRGTAAALLDGAVGLARRGGATLVEAYPWDLAVRRASSAELYHGSLSIFLGAGFIEVARPLPHRAVVRRHL
jgi:GNAT superfamily N-acetyltransferase